jgi:hypothetical protein
MRRPDSKIPYIKPQKNDKRLRVLPGVKIPKRSLRGKREKTDTMRFPLKKKRLDSVSQSAENMV